MRPNPKQKENLARLVRGIGQPVKYDSRYANTAEAVCAVAEELRVQLYGPEGVYGDDDEGGEYHPYFRNRNASDWNREMK